jgi:hypothetical protein
MPKMTTIAISPSVHKLVKQHAKRFGLKLQYVVDCALVTYLQPINRETKQDAGPNTQ